MKIQGMATGDNCFSSCACDLISFLFHHFSYVQQFLCEDKHNCRNIRNIKDEVLCVKTGKGKMFFLKIVQ